MRLALWTPRPYAPWVAALLPLLRREADVAVVDEAGGSGPEADLHLYHVADEPAHSFVFEALLGRPGVVLLADWGLRRLARASAAGDVWEYLAEARRAHGETGTFVARQLELGRGGDVLGALLTLNDRVLEASLGLVAFNEYVRVRAAARVPGGLVVRLPLDFVGRHENLPDRAGARQALGLPGGAAVVAALSPESTRALESLPAGEPLVVRAWPDREDEAPLLLASADVAVALEYPARGRLHAPLVRALAAGLPTLVSAGSAAAAEMEDGVVVKVSPGRTEGAELAALLDRLLADPALRTRIGALARTRADASRDPGRPAAALLDFARDVLRTAPEALRAFHADRARDGALLAWAFEEVRWGARDLGLAGLPLGLEPLVGPLFGRTR